MANQHIYFGIENLNLTNGQRNQLITGLQGLGQANSGLPFQRNHQRIRPDNQAAIFEGLFDENNITIAAIKSRLATIFGVSAALISHATQQTVYGLVITYTYQSVARLRMVAFGHTGSAWADRETSRSAAQAYLAANAAAWAQSVIAAQPVGLLAPSAARLMRSKGRARIQRATRRVIQTAVPVIKPAAASMFIVFVMGLLALSRSSVPMGFSAEQGIQVLIAVLAAAILVRNFIQALKGVKRPDGKPVIEDGQAGHWNGALSFLVALGGFVLTYFGAAEKIGIAELLASDLTTVIVTGFVIQAFAWGIHWISKRLEGVKSGALPVSFSTSNAAAITHNSSGAERP